MESRPRRGDGAVADLRGRLEDGEPLLSRRCAGEKGARYVAESFRQDLVRTGWSEIDES